MLKNLLLLTLFITNAYAGIPNVSKKTLTAKYKCIDFKGKKVQLKVKNKKNETQFRALSRAMNVKFPTKDLIAYMNQTPLSRSNDNRFMDGIDIIIEESKTQLNKLSYQIVHDLVKNETSIQKFTLTSKRNNFFSKEKTIDCELLEVR